MDSTNLFPVSSPTVRKPSCESSKRRQVKVSALGKEMLEELQAFSLSGVTSSRTVKLQGFSAYLRSSKMHGRQARLQSTQLNAPPTNNYTSVHLFRAARSVTIPCNRYATAIGNFRHIQKKRYSLRRGSPHTPYLSPFSTMKLPKRWVNDATARLRRQIG